MPKIEALSYKPPEFERGPSKVSCVLYDPEKQRESLI